MTMRVNVLCVVELLFIWLSISSASPSDSDSEILIKEFSPKNFVDLSNIACGSCKLKNIDCTQSVIALDEKSAIYNATGYCLNDNSTFVGTCCLIIGPADCEDDSEAQDASLEAQKFISTTPMSTPGNTFTAEPLFVSTSDWAMSAPDYISTSESIPVQSTEQSSWQDSTTPAGTTTTTQQSITTSVPTMCSFSDPASRTECGWPGITRDTCESRGCCFDDKIINAKFCYSKIKYATRRCDNSNPSSRVECGWPGVSRAECEGRDCCFDDTVPNVKWCFGKV